LSLNTSISSLKGKETVSVNVTGNTQEYEIKIRTLNSRIQELESQIRTQKIDLEGQLRTKTNYIKELEERLGKLGESGVTASQSQGGLTPYGGTETSGADRLSSSVHSSQSGNERTTSRYGTTTTSTYQAGSGTAGQTTYTSSTKYESGTSGN
jgi:TolA-binding protein